MPAPPANPYNVLVRLSLPEARSLLQIIKLANSTLRRVDSIPSWRLWLDGVGISPRVVGAIEAARREDRRLARMAATPQPKPKAKAQLKAQPKTRSPHAK